jgi:hypothetical protein
MAKTLAILTRDTAIFPEKIIVTLFFNKTVKTFDPS